MNFLAPLFLVGGVAIAGPILFHLIRRTTRDVTPFSTLMFLQPTPPRVSKRSRLENLWLLLLRCLVLGLLALGFGRPFFQQAPPTPPAAGLELQRTVLLLDTSASMRREELWPLALEKARAYLKAAAPTDEIAVVTFDRAVRTVAGFEEWKTWQPSERAAVVEKRLAELSPGWGGTQLDTALLRAADMLDRPGEIESRTRRIVVIGDGQEGARVDGLQGFEWPRGVEVVMDTLTAKQPANVSAAWVSESEENKDGAPVRLRVSAASQSKREQYRLKWSVPGAPDNAAAPGLEVYVPAGQSRIVRVPAAGDAAQTALVLSGDEVPFDNTLFVRQPQPAPVPLLFLGSDREEDPKAALYYLRRAFPKKTGGAQAVEVVVAKDEALLGFELSRAQLVVLGEQVPESALDAVAATIKEGRIALVALSSAASASMVARLLQTPAFISNEAPPKDYALLAQVDFQHPIFAPFADPRFGDFTKIHFWKHRRFAIESLPKAKVLAAFDDGDPALVQVPLGKGSVLILASSWRPSDSQLALSSKFLPLLHSILEQSSQLPSRKAQYLVGDEIPLPPAATASKVQKPDGKIVESGPRFLDTDQPGIYKVTPGDLELVVNMAPEESRTAPLSLDRLSALGVPLHKDASASVKKERDPKLPVLAQAAELEQSQKIWRWLIVAALAALGFETLLATKLSSSGARRLTQNP